MKNHRFPWLRNRTTDNRKCEKARNIKGKRTIEMFNQVSKQLVEHHSSQRDNFRQMCIHTPDFGLGCFFYNKNNKYDAKNDKVLLIVHPYVLGL